MLVLLETIKQYPEKVLNYLNNISIEYDNRIDKLILNFLSYILKNKKFMDSKFFEITKYILHNNARCNDYLLKYLVYSLNKLF